MDVANEEEKWKSHAIQIPTQDKFITILKGNFATDKRLFVLKTRTSRWFIKGPTPYSKLDFLSQQTFKYQTDF